MSKRSHVLRLFAAKFLSRSKLQKKKEPSKRIRGAVDFVIIPRNVVCKLWSESPREWYQEETEVRLHLAPGGCNLVRHAQLFAHDALLPVTEHGARNQNLGIGGGYLRRWE